jgi:hypothetical protein
MKICGLWLDIHEVHGPFLQSGGNKGINGFNLQREILWTESTVRWTVGGADTGRGGALPARGTRMLGLIGAHRWGAIEENDGGGRCAGERLARAKREARTE